MPQDLEADPRRKAELSIPIIAYPETLWKKQYRVCMHKTRSTVFACENCGKKDRWGFTAVSLVPCSYTMPNGTNAPNIKEEGHEDKHICGGYHSPSIVNVLPLQLRCVCCLWCRVHRSSVWERRPCV